MHIFCSQTLDSWGMFANRIPRGKGNMFLRWRGNPRLASEEKQQGRPQFSSIATKTEFQLLP